MPGSLVFNPESTGSHCGLKQRVTVRSVLEESRWLLAGGMDLRRPRVGARDQRGRESRGPGEEASQRADLSCLTGQEQQNCERVAVGAEGQGPGAG